MTIALAAVSAALAVLLIVLVTILVVRRSSGGADERIADAVADMNARMEAMVRELSQALERAEEESRRNRVFGELASTIDLDEVLERLLETARELPGADAALVSVVGVGEGRPVVATYGLSTEEAARQGVIAGPPDGRPVRSIAIAYRYGAEEVDGDGTVIHAGLAVPLVLEDEPLGYLAIFSRTPGYRYEEAVVRELEALGERSTPTLGNALRFREARQLADLDALTGLHNRRFFHETLAREVARGQRYDRQLALIVFDLDDFKAVNDQIGHLAGDGVLADVAERVRGVVRSADVACRVGGDEFAVILPESALVDADQLYRRIQQAVSSQPFGQAGRLYLSAGVAELRPEDDARALFERADEALYRAKQTGKGRSAEAAGGVEANGAEADGAAS